MKKILLVSSALLACSSVFALSYKDNTYQKLADEYSQKVQAAIDAGEYELSIEYSKLVEENSALSKEYVQKMIAKDEASDAMKDARAKIDLVKNIKSDKIDIETLAEAEKSYSYAKIEFDRDTEEGYKTAKKYANQITESFSALANFLNSSLLFNEIETARSNAINEDAEKYYPKQLASFDAQRDLLKDDFKADENADLSKPLKDLLKKYQSLEKASAASSLKDCLIAYDSKNNNDFSKKIKNGDSELEKYAKIDVSASGDEFYSQSEKAFNAYNELANKDFAEIVANERCLALDAKELAEFEKAQINPNTRVAYEKAADIVRAADVDFLEKNNKEALKGYKDAKKSYISQYEIVKNKRVDAQNYLESVEDLISSINLDAAKADKMVPLKSKADFIDDSDKKLLDDYSFADPKDFIIDLKEIKKPEITEVKADVSKAEKSEETKSDSTKSLEVEETIKTEVTNAIEVVKDEAENVLEEDDVPVEVIEDEVKDVIPAKNETMDAK